MRFRSILFFFYGVFSASNLRAATLTVNITDQNSNLIENAVVYIKSVNGQSLPSTPKNIEVDQIDEMFVPHLSAITIGSQVSFPNSDHIRHHVYSFSEAMTFEIPLYIGIPAAPIRFDHTGLVTLGCNIHDHMLGYILVVDTPLIAQVTAGIGRFEVVPGGELALEIWHPLLAGDEVLKQSLTVTAEENAVLHFQIELRPERMVRRAPRRNGNRY